MVPIEPYFNRHTGHIYILGNGPSLANYNLSNLDPNETMTMNRSWKAVPGALYHCASGDLRIKFTPPLPQHFLFLGQPSQYPNLNLGRPIINVQTRILGVHIPKPKSDLGIPEKFDLRFGWSITHCGLFALQAAWFLGFREINLLGYDGYGGHFTKEDWNLTPDHKKIIPEFVRISNELAAYDSSLRVYNCNPENAYGNFPVKRLDFLTKA